jgi:RNA polymerase sigma-32 factor
MAKSPSFDAESANRAFIRKVMKAPLLSADYEHDLARRWREQGDEAALHELVGAYFRLVVATAARFRSYGLPLSDLIQEGNIGLMQAAARFEPARQVRFSTYAGWWVRAAIQDFILRNWSIVRTGTTAAQKTLFFNLRRLRARIAADPEGRLSPAERRQVAHALRVPLAEVEAMEGRLAAGDRSLNATIAEGGEAAWQDLLADERPDPEQAVLALRDGATRARWLHQAMAGLTPRERTIIEERRLADEAVTLEVLGRELGISKERVRQLEERAMKKLREALLAAAGNDDPEATGLIPA